MKSPNVIIVFLCSLLIISLYSCVPEEVILHGDIYGHVTDVKSSQPLDSVFMALTQFNQIIDTTQTESDGSYQINNIPPGNYELEISKPTFEKRTENVTVESKKSVNINFEIGMIPYPSISDTLLDFGLDSVTRTVAISNMGSGTLRYSLFTSQDWLDIDSKEGEITSETDFIQVSINRAGLLGKKEKGEIRISYDLDGELEVAIVKVWVNGVMDMDGNYYGAVRIGTQTWLSENLNTGRSVFFLGGAFAQYDNEVIEKWCHDNDIENCNVYGGTYSWAEMMDYPEEQEAIGITQGICPAGWHIPSFDEWMTLTEYAGGMPVVGGKLKDTGTLQEGTGLWYAPNTGASNEYGFSALPGGAARQYDSFTYLGIGEKVEFWTSSIESGTHLFVFLNWNSSGLEIGSEPADSKFPSYVRCIKNP